MKHFRKSITYLVCFMLFFLSFSPSIALAANNNALLSSITLDDVAIADFDSNTFTYNVNVDAAIDEITIAATPEDTNAIIAGATGTQTLSVGANTFTITCTAEDGVATQDYTLNINRAAPPLLSTDATLSDITIDGSTIEGFASNTFSYNLTVANTIEQIVVGAISSNDNAQVAGDTGTQSLSVGANTMTITCTAEDGVTTQDYVLNITREDAPVLSNDATLSDITIDGSTIVGFTSDTFSYNLTVSNTVEEIEIGALSTNTNANITGDIGTQNITVGTNTFTITCTAQDGVSKQDYILNISKYNNLVITPDGIIFNKETGIITNYTGNVSNLVIPDTIQGASVVKIGNHAFREHKSLTSITIPTSVLSIGDCAFTETGLINVNIPDTITSIGYEAFSGCEDLVTIDLGDGLIYLNSLFYNCQNLTSIVIGKSVNNINLDTFRSSLELTSITVDEQNSIYKSIDGVLFSKDVTILYKYPRKKYETNYVLPDTVMVVEEKAFWGAHIDVAVLPESLTEIKDNTFNTSTLNQITIPNNVASIGYKAFSECNNLALITISNSVTSIEQFAFEKTGLINVYIPDSVNSIGSDAFSYCEGLLTVEIGNGLSQLNNIFSGSENLTSLVLGKSINEINMDAFQGSLKLNSITVDEDNSTYKSIDGVLFSKDGSTLYMYPRYKENTSYTIPDSVDIIETEALMGTDIDTIVLSNNLTNIKERAFAYSGITEMIIPNSVTYIGDLAFSQCTDMGSLTLGNGITVIEYGTFANCDSLTEVIVPRGVSTISTKAFTQCINMLRITIPETVTEIGSFAFGDHNEDFTIYGAHDSYAQKYANQISVPFIPINDTDAGLSSLKLDGATITGFSRDKYIYHVSYDQLKTSVNISAIASDTDAQLTGDFGTQNLSEGMNTFTLTCTAKNGITKNDYVIYISITGSVSDNAFENLGFIPLDISIDPDRKVAYATKEDGYKLYRVDLTTGEICYLEFIYKAERLTIKNGKVYLTLPHNPHLYNTPNDDEGTGTIIVINTATFTISNHFDVSLDPYDVEADSQGNIYIGPGSNQWSIVASYNSNTGECLSTRDNVRYLSLWDYNEKYNKLYSADSDSSPCDIEAYEVTNGVIDKKYDSPYHGDYSMSTYMKISPDGQFIFSGSGNIFTCAPKQDGDMIYTDNIDSFDSICFDINNNVFYTSKDKVLKTYNYYSRTVENTTSLQDELVEIFYEHDKLIFLQKNSEENYYIDFGTTASSQAGKVALLFGMADYTGDDNDLNGPVNDMIGTQAVLEHAGYRVYRYMNYDAADVLNTVEAVASNLSPDSTLLFAYSGHGSDGGYLVGADLNGISINDLESKLSQHTGVKEVIIDACYSGDFIDKNINSKMVKINSQKDFNEYIISVFKDNNIKPNSKSLAENGYYVITACSGDQLSYEFAFSIPNSPFASDNLTSVVIEDNTYYILGYFSAAFHEGFGLYNDTSFSSLLADTNSDNILTWNEIYHYTAERTNDEQQAQVYPTNSSHELYHGNVSVPTELLSTTYSIDQTNSIAKKVRPKTSVDDFKSNFSNSSSQIKIYDSEDNEITTGYVGTGMKVKLVIDNEVKDELKICIMGDISGDGIVDITDILYIRAHIIGTYTIENVAAIAAELNNDDIIDITDILYIRAHIIGTYDIHAN